MAGLIVEILFMLFYAYNAALWAENEFEAYWLTDFLLINSWARDRK